MEMKNFLGYLEMYCFISKHLGSFTYLFVT